MERDASHSVPLQSIQRLAIELHALDESSLSLGRARTHDDGSQETFELYRELLTERLLQIAAALRTKFYQGYSAEGTAKYLEQTGFLEVYRKGESKLVDITFKDICDKIIHAESITRQFDSGHREQGVLTILVGTNQSGSRWRMALCVSLFAEAVLNWARDSAAYLTPLQGTSRSSSHSRLCTHPVGEAIEAADHEGQTAHLQTALWHRRAADAGPDTNRAAGLHSLVVIALA